MNRLTKLFATTSCNNKVEKQFLLLEFSGDTDYQQKMVDKLGELEDIEEEMDFDLLTLFNIEKVYWRVKWVDDIGYSDVKCAYKIYLDVVNRCLLVYNEYDDFGHKLYFKDYGKTWALSEEELE